MGNVHPYTVSWDVLQILSPTMADGDHENNLRTHVGDEHIVSRLLIT